MPPSKSTYDPQVEAPRSVLREDGIEYGFLGRLQGLKYDYRPDITNRATLEKNFREKFEALNRVRLTDADCQERQRPPITRSHSAEPPRSEGQFARLLDEIVVADVFTASKTLRSINSFTRDDGTPLNYTLVNLKDWCKNHFEVINQLRRVKVEVRRQKAEENHERRTRPQGMYQTVCLANHSPVRKPAKINGGSGSRKTTAPLGNVRRGELPRSPSRTKQSRVHRKVRRLAAGVGGKHILAGTPRRWRNGASRQAATASCRMRRVDRHLPYDHQASEGGRNSEGRMRKDHSRPTLLLSSFLLLPFHLLATGSGKTLSAATSFRGEGVALFDGSIAGRDSGGRYSSL